MASVAKKEIRELIDDLPDDYTKEQIIHEIYVQQKIDHALADPRPAISIEESIKEGEEWREKGRP